MATITSISQIARIPLHNDPEAELRGDTLQKAAQLFDYKAQSFNAFGPLAKALSALDIIPYKEEEVRAYMASKKRNIKVSWSFLTWLLIPCFFLPITLWIERLCLPSWKAVFHVAPTLPNIFFFIIFGIGGAAFCHDFIPSVRYIREWTTHAFGNPHGYEPTYPRYIPIHVLNYAVQIREALPKASFLIHELTSKTETTIVPRHDPFLEVVLGPEHYFIAAWDEKDFEAKR